MSEDIASLHHGYGAIARGRIDPVGIHSVRRDPEGIGIAVDSNRPQEIAEGDAGNTRTGRNVLVEVVDAERRVWRRRRETYAGLEIAGAGHRGSGSVVARRRRGHDLRASVAAIAEQEDSGGYGAEERRAAQRRRSGPACMTPNAPVNVS